MAGFTVGAALSWGCTRGNDRKLVPYLIAPEEVVPGRPYWYASVCGACPAGCGVLTKNLDGRPVKIEGNPEHPVSRGGLCAAGQASVLALYDDQRLRAPLQRGVESTWQAIDGLLEKELERLASAGARVRFLTDSCAGPADLHAIDTFLGRFADSRLVVYDPIGTAAILDAHEESHGARALPRFHFDKAEVIVSFGADFLGAWVSPAEHTFSYHQGRQPGPGQTPFSYHVQLESRLCLTGSNADQRIVLPPDGTTVALARLAHRVERGLGKTPVWTELPAAPISPQVIDELARRLLAVSPGRSLVVCGENDRQAQLIVNHLNELLGNYSSGVVDLSQRSHQRRGDDRALLELRDEMTRGEVRLEASGAISITLPVLVQPGQHPQAVAIALGYGRSGTDRFSRIGPRWLEGSPTVEPGGVIGANAAPLISVVDGYLQTSRSAVKLVATGARRPVACTQQHHSLHIPEHLAFGEDTRRDIVPETTVLALHNDNRGGRHGHDEHASLWQAHLMRPHHWGMVVDLAACTGTRAPGRCSPASTCWSTGSCRSWFSWHGRRNATRA